MSIVLVVVPFEKNSSAKHRCICFFHCVSILCMCRCTDDDVQCTYTQTVKTAKNIVLSPLRKEKKQDEKNLSKRQEMLLSMAYHPHLCAILTSHTATKRTEQGDREGTKEKRWFCVAETKQCFTLVFWQILSIMGLDLNKTDKNVHFDLLVLTDMQSKFPNQMSPATSNPQEQEMYPKGWKKVGIMDWDAIQSETTQISGNRRGTRGLGPNLLKNCLELWKNNLGKAITIVVTDGTYDQHIQNLN